MPAPVKKKYILKKNTFGWKGLVFELNPYLKHKRTKYRYMSIHMKIRDQHFNHEGVYKRFTLVY